LHLPCGTSLAVLSASSPPITQRAVLTTLRLGDAVQIIARAARVLLVDHEESPTTALHAHLLGYEVRRVAGAEEALDHLVRDSVDVVALNLDLPEGAGPDLLRRMLALRPTPVILAMSAVNDVERAVEYLRQGVADYIIRPTEPARLAQALERALKARLKRGRRMEAQQILRREVARLTVKLRRSQERTKRVSVASLQSLVHLMEVGDRYLAGHSLRVAQMAASGAAELGRSAREIEILRTAARLHDIGMLCIGDGIRSKAGALTPEEYDRVKHHVSIGSDILAQLPGLESAASFVRSHHERWDGTGYPDGLNGDAIPWGAQLIGAAEVYDALTTLRPYRKALSAEQAAERMQEMRGTTLSPDACDALTMLVKHRRALVFLEPEREHPLGAVEGRGV
jgi:putative two-component system response regulator